ncbi:DUF624 domain-containing protein [Vagococcus sp. BWB3-3]|uniref:DUF624 domain-containing protein n=1 Tax=Vagococcus allomyrinae TaxID=2794353 RepID=A0A940PDB5_9ENTE|nr:DUF624 domain-containing protein [Vagococcus allomyrinae]MBP1041421.1 DUF624 domain-containing protein [Vagococcus allomyrinae]
MKPNLMNRFLNTVWLLFLLNLCLVVTNPLIVAAFFIKGSLKLVSLAVGVLLFSPSLTATLFLLNNPVEENVIGMFVRRYRREFKEAVLLGLPTVLLSLVLVVNLIGVKLFPKFQSLSPLFMILLVLVVVFYFYQCLFFANFEMTLKVSFKFALQFFLDNMVLNAGVMLVQLIALFMARQYMGYFCLIGFSGTLFLMNLIVKNKLIKMKQIVNLHEGGMTFEHF